MRQRNTASDLKPSRSSSVIHSKQKSSRISSFVRVSSSSEEHSLSSELSSELDSFTVVELLSTAALLEHGPVELVDMVARDSKQDSETDGVVVTKDSGLLGIGPELEVGVKVGVEAGVEMGVEVGAEAGVEIGVDVGVEIVGADSLSSLLLLAEAEPA